MRRQMKKLMEQNEPKEIVDEQLVKQVHQIEQQKKQKQVFQMMEISDSEDELQQEYKDEECQTNLSEETIQTQNDQSNKNQKKKKNKNKKKKEKKQQQELYQKCEQNQDDDFEFLDKIQAQQTQQQQDQIMQFQESDENGPLSINIKRLNYNKELQQYFKNAKIAGGGQQKKGHKNVKQQYLTYNPAINIPLPDKFNVKFGNLNEQGLQLFSLVASQQYDRLQSDYTIVKGYYDPSAIFNFLQMNPSHCEAQFDVSEYFRLKGDYKQANELLERLLYIYESSLGYAFNKFFEKPSVNLEIEDNIHSKVFLMSLFKFTDVLSRKGCYKAALEFSKILLKFCPTRDPYGALFLIDCNSIKAQQYEYLINFASNFVRSVYKTNRSSIVFMPNMIYNCALAKFLEQGENHQYSFKDENIIEAINNFGPHPLQASHQVLIIQSILLYPIVLKQLAESNEFIKQNVGNLDSFIENQRKPFKELLTEEFLQRETYLHWFLQLDAEQDNEGFLKSISIFVEKSKSQWKSNEILKWIKGALGLIINNIKSQKLDLSSFYEDLTVVKEGTTIYNEIPFQYRRYKELSKSHFLENPERLDFNNIFAENIGAQQQQPQQQFLINFNPLNANNGLLQAIFGTLLPWVHHPNAQM
ncbi:unnamed protein product [Paramecium sonneborni]|uniref:Transcription factor 25 n=1 Tax=Paramecium sonneborni TaxID=65129 RepID=A0A8S1NY18_9CILI|nr:unnamed protein product [Paramecium sonneborni]